VLVIIVVAIPFALRADADALASEGQGALLLPLRGRPGDQGARRADRHGQSSRHGLRLVRRRRAVTSARAAFGERIEDVLAEESGVSYRIADLRMPLSDVENRKSAVGNRQ